MKNLIAILIVAFLFAFGGEALASHGRGPVRNAINARRQNQKLNELRRENAIAKEQLRRAQLQQLKLQQLKRQQLGNDHCQQQLNGGYSFQFRQQFNSGY